MKQILLILGIVCLVLTPDHSSAQCTTAQLNWDQLNYYFNSGSNIAPYGHSSGNYVTNAQEQTQRFGIGPNYVTMVTSAAGIVRGENGTHTGDIAGYTGDDAQFTPSANGQTITLTFNAEVENTFFTLYDVDVSARIDIDAYNTANVKQSVTITRQGTTILSRTDGTNAFFTANSTSLANSDNRGTATISVTNPINRIVITATTIGSDAVFWLSDINACVTGSFPTNYQQTGNNQPFTGPNGNQPDYFIGTPDNNSAYMIDPATGNASLLFTDAAKTYINSFAYDPYNRYLYYMSENVSVDGNNRELKRYNFNTGTSSVFIADITATLGIPTMGSGVESAGAAFYDGALYLGIEGGRYGSGSGTVTRETIFWRIDLDASQNPIVAYQAFATDAYVDGANTSIHDFGDFIIKNGVLYSFNTARNSSNYSQSKYHQLNLTTGAVATYNNPGTTTWNGQAGMTWAGGLYYFRTTGSGTSGVGLYNEAGVNNAPVNITVVDGSPAWPGGAGDAAENFRPQVDFGDAPASYDPILASPAVHTQNANLRLGASFDEEWVVRGQTALANSDNFDDGLPFISTFNPVAGEYLIEVDVFNNTGSDATLCGWLDYNGNGTFESGEGISTTVSSSASVQQVYLFWPSISSGLSNGTYTYLRLRVTGVANAMTTAHSTGWFSTGEVEDYRVPVNSYALSVQSLDFNAQLTQAKTTHLSWNSADESNTAFYMIERSINNLDWEMIKSAKAATSIGLANYDAIDENTLPGTSYYRLKISGKDGKFKISTVKKIENKIGRFSISVAPNPASVKSFVYINSNNTTAKKATIEVINSQGALVYKEKTQVVKGTNSIELPVISKLTAGRYIIRVTVDNNSSSQSLIINK